MNERPKLSAVDSESPCVCGSKQSWGRCCGKYLSAEDRDGVVAGTIDPQAVRFLLTNRDCSEVYVDNDFRIVVFTTRAQALAHSVKLNADLRTLFGVAGLDKKRWEVFKREFPHVLWPDSIS